MGKENALLSVAAVIPSLNPDAKLNEVVDGLFAIGFSRVIVVDDGSHEDCQHVFKQLESNPSCTVLHHEHNCGKGRALKTAFAYYFDNFDLSVWCGTVTADADGQHLPQDIYHCAQELQEHPNSLVLGARNLNAENVPFKSRNGNKLTATMLRLLYGKRVNDVMTGLRGIPNDVMRNGMSIAADGFEFETKMLLEEVLSKRDIAEVIIQTVYFDGNRETHFNPVRDSIRVYKVLLGSFIRFACSGVACVILDQGLFALFQKVVLRAMPDNNAIILATVFSRTISSLVNYILNRTMVFEQKQNTGKSMLRYYILCACQMAASAGGVTALHALTKLDPSIVKLVVDTILFFASYRIQQRWVFRKET